MSNAGIRPRFVDVVSDAGISYRQADYWCRRGFINTRRQHPELPEGSGNPRIIDDDEIAVMRTMARLVKAGFTPETAAVIARADSRLTEVVICAVESLTRQMPDGNPAAARQETP